jgi:2-aminoethylphosphonate dioxygenase
MSASVLSPQQIAQFHQDGFLVVPDFFSEEEANSFDQMAKDLENAPDVRGSLWKYWNMQPPVANKETERFLDRVENFVDFHEGWGKLFLSSDSRLVKAVSELFGEEAVLWKEKLNYKKPGSSGFAPHQDAQVSNSHPLLCFIFLSSHFSSGWLA